jgi:queuine tRNA-ribosyltransferase
MFDCVIPTRNARHGILYTKNGILNIKNEKWKKDFSFIDEEGTSFVDNYYTKAYLRHLFVAGEMLAAMIASIHNLRFYMWLTEEAHQQILNGSFAQWKNQLVKNLNRRL